jgi:histidinol-phosphate aminotransferase
MSRYWSEAVRALEPYTPGEQPRERQYVKLNTNENPYPPSPKVLAALRDSADERLRLYPDPTCDDLRAAIASACRVDRSEVFVGNGSDEILSLVFFSFFKGERAILFPDITYSFYEVYCTFHGITGRQIPLREDFTIAPEDYNLENGGIIFANPNAPTGAAVSLGQIERLLGANKDSVVVVDEAYVDFGGESAVPLVRSCPNLLVVQTLSKSRSLAGLRVGLAVGAPELIAGLERARYSFNPYNLDRLALAGAIESFRDEEYFQENCRRVIDTRERSARRLAELGFSVVPSRANFLFITHAGHSAKELLQGLRDRGVLVRHFDRPRISDYLRVTVGTDDEMEIFLEQIGELTGGIRYRPAT